MEPLWSLIDIRQNDGMSQEDMARVLGVSVKEVQNTEGGECVVGEHTIHLWKQATLLGKSNG